MNYQYNLYHNYNMSIDYPKTSYYKLNKKIDSIIEKYKFNFISSLMNYNIQSDITYTFNISYKEYRFKNYISIILYIEEYTGGAHPNHYISSIIYDIKANDIISIIDLVKQDKKILDILSSESRELLLKKYKININDINIKQMFYDGTSPSVSNFKNIAFTTEGLLIIFERYSIAPYYMGEFQIIIPYNKINNFNS